MADAPPMTVETGVTIFSAPKPFVDPHIATIQRNAVGSWLQLGGSVEVLLLGDEPGIEQAARELGARHLGLVDRNAQGTPLISSIFAAAHGEARYPMLAYLNADIVLLPDFLPTLQQVAAQLDRFLLVGQRWDLELGQRLAFHNGWQSELRERLEREGRLHPPAGSDYFAFPKGLFKDLPPFALGRAGWDNWMIYAGRRRGIPVVDATAAVTAIHQQHGYAHLQGGRPHYDLPESEENVRLAGGRQTVFTLRDATWRVDSHGLKRRRWPGPGLRRWVEAEVVSRLGPGSGLRLIWALLHPVRTIRRLWSAARQTVGRYGRAGGGH